MEHKLPDYLEHTVSTVEEAVLLQNNPQVVKTLIRALVNTVFTAGKDEALKSIQDQKKKDWDEEMRKPPRL